VSAEQGMVEPAYQLSILDFPLDFAFASALTFEMYTINMLHDWQTTGKLH
jgi:hypothetical protein